MYVIKRDGLQQQISFDKITSRIQQLMYGLDQQYVDPIVVSQKVCAGVYKGVTTSELDELAAETAANLSSNHPDYAVLAARIAISNLHKNTKKNFFEVMTDLYTYVDPKTDKPAPLVSDYVYDFIKENADVLNAAVIYHRDHSYDYFGFKTLERSYLLKLNGQIAERPQHMLMRVSCGIHYGNLPAVLETYTLMSEKWFTHASPTLFNSGTPRPQLSSCFLVTMKDDSIEGIYDTLKICAQISKQAGGIGLAVHDIRATGSYIRGTNGTSNGLVPMLRVFNQTARYVDQCFAPDTLVFTKAGPKRIASLVAGEDEVLSHSGAFRRVDQLVEHDVAEQMLSVQVEHALRPVRVTGTHQVLALQGHPDTPLDVVHTRLVNGAAQPAMTDARDLQQGDLLCFPVPSPDTEQDLPALSAEHAVLLGLTLGDRTASPSHASVAGDEQALAFARDQLSAWGVAFQEGVCAKTGRACLSWNPSDPQLGLESVFDCVQQKHVPTCYLHLPQPKLLAVVKGLLWACGAPTAGDALLAIAEPSVLEAVRWMLLRCGILAAGEEGSLRVPLVQAITALGVAGLGQSGPASYIAHQGVLYSRIRSIKADPATGPPAVAIPAVDAAAPAASLAGSMRECRLRDLGATTKVYDLEVDEDHTYVTEFGAVHNGGGKRKGAFAAYLEPWHADVMDFLDLRKNHGSEEHRARDLFYALWVCDLFMKRVENNELWSLFCPNEAPGLADVWGEDFERLYTKYEHQGKARDTIKARTLWSAILDSQQETGTPYILYKDACNRKSNQQNLGTIRSSNLCTEIVEYTSPDEVAVCNLASIALNRFVNEAAQTYDFKRLYEVTKVVTRNLNRVIDVNYYPVPEAERSNLSHRPVGLGVQGLADALILLGLPYESEAAQQLNRDIFATLYYAALDASCELAARDGHYASYPGSPVSRGELQFDMWGVEPTTAGGLLDWAALKARIAKHGVRNSLLVAPMPTASTSQILGNNESFEAYTSNLYVRRTLAGEFVCVNAHLLRALIKQGLWTAELKNKLIAHNGSVQALSEVPQSLRELFKTVWEMKGRVLVDMAADRGAYIDQSQSFNVHMPNVNYAKLTSMHFYAWKKGLKTGMYYLRTKAAADAIKFTVDPIKTAEIPAPATAPTAAPAPAPAPAPRSPARMVSKTPLKKEERRAEEQEALEAWRREREKQRADVMCALDNKDECLSCGS